MATEYFIMGVGLIGMIVCIVLLVMSNKRYRQKRMKLIEQIKLEYKRMI